MEDTTTSYGTAMIDARVHDNDHGRNDVRPEPSVIVEQDILKQRYGKKNWRVKLHGFLHSHVVIIGLAALLLLDIVFIVITLSLDASYPACHVILKQCACDDDGGKLSPTCISAPTGIRNFQLALSILSLIILVIFLIELFFMFAAVGTKLFCTSPFLVLDTLIILISMGLEGYIIWKETSERSNLDEEHSNESVAAASAIVIVFSRSWRLLRIGHGAFKEAHDFYEDEIERLKDQIIQLKRAVPSHEANSSQ
jgi:hypothetical protein